MTDTALLPGLPFDEAETPTTDAAATPKRQAPATKRRHEPDGPTLILIDPARVRVSSLNPRLQDKQTDADLAELTLMIRSVGQLSPVGVRRLVDDPEHDYELLYGMRRYLAVSSLRREDPDLLLKAEVIDTDDKTAARLIDTENRGRQAISAYERALFLAHRLKEVPGGKQVALAADFSIDEALLSRLLVLASWPPDLFDAWGDRRSITPNDATVINPHFTNKATREPLLAAAEKVAAEQRERRALPKPQAYLRPSEVRRRLLAAVSAAKQATDVFDNGNRLLTLRSQTRSGLLLYVHEGEPARQDRILRAITNAIVEARSAGTAD